MTENTAFRDIPYMGVIRVVVEAMKLGYRQEDPSWANLGQGQPEVGTLAGAPPRMDHVPVLPGDYAYGPVEGLPELREAVAAHYNRLYRRGMGSRYKAENVVVAAGGRTSLTRGAAALDEGRLGYFIPDYTAYEDLLTAFRRFTPVLAGATQDSAFRVDPKELEERINHAHLSALILSNPCNPTGRTITGPELAEWVNIARRRKCTLLMDEYYSHFTYAASADEPVGPVSTAAFVDDVNRDPVVIFDGLTKNYRYPGWRVGWAIGPVEAVRAMTAGGSFVDGGPPRPMQRAAVEILEPSRADQETNAVRKEFRRKRDLTVERLTQMGITLPRQPEGTFYAFGCIRDLPPQLNDGVAFHYESMKHRVLTVPGEYFDVNPFRSRPGPSPLAGYVRFSFGPPMKTLSEGLDRLAEMVKRARG